MAILNGKDLLSSKFITAEISDSSDRLHYVPIKNSIGDYFIADLDGQLFAFTMKNARILTHRRTLTKSFRVVQFDTSHYSSLKPETKALELVLQKNALPTVDRMLYDVLRVLGRREKENFGKYQVGEKIFDTEKQAKKYYHSLDEDTIKANDIEIKYNIHSIDELIKIFDGKEGEFPEQVKRIKNYLAELDVKEVVTPVRKITDFISNDLIATSPSYLGGMLQQYHRVQGELRVITNRPEKPTTSYMKFLVVALIIGMGSFAVFIAYDSGAFKGIEDFAENLGTIQEGFKGLPSPTQGIQRSSTGGIDYSDAAIQSKYPDCNALKVDIQSGVVDYNKLSSATQGFIDTCPEP